MELNAASTRPGRPHYLALAADWIDAYWRWVWPWLTALLTAQIYASFRLNCDAMSYLSVARNLARHGAFINRGSPHVHFALGYPVIISPAYLFAHPFVVIQTMHLALSVLLLAGIYRWFRLCTGPGAALVAALVMVNVAVWDSYRQPWSENAFMPLEMWAAVLLGMAARTRSHRQLWAAMAGAVVLVMATVAVRQIGVFLAAGFAAAMLVQKLRGQISWRRALVCTLIVGMAAIAVFLALKIYDDRTAVGSGTVSYAQLTRENLDSPDSGVIEGLRRQTGDIGRLLTPGLWKTYARQGEWWNINTILFLLVCIPIALGWWRLARATADPLALTFPFYFVFCVCFPFDNGTRYTLPMLPVLAAAIWYACQALKGRAGKEIFLVLVVLHLSVTLGFWLNNSAIERRWAGEWPALTRAVTMIPIDQGAVAERGLPYEQWVSLMYLSDRQIDYLAKGEAAGANTRWLLLLKNAADEPGFQVVQQKEGIKLEQRE